MNVLSMGATLVAALTLLAAWMVKNLRFNVWNAYRIFFPLVKASLGSDTASTKTDSITFGTTNTTFIIFPCNSGDWRFTEEFDTEAEAIAWVKAFTPASDDAGTGGGAGGTELRHASSKI